MERYARQLILDAIGEAGQQKLLESTVCVVGCGGLGSIAAPYLAGSGVGTLILVDADAPDESNLHRQVFYHVHHASQSKAAYLAEHIAKMNPEIEIQVFSEFIQKDNIDKIIASSDLVLECTDQIMTKYLLNDYCHLHHIPMVYGAIHKYDGYVSFFDNASDDSIHLRDIFPEPNTNIPSCSEVGVLGTLAGIIGLMQANEAIKYLSSCGTLLTGTLLHYNALSNDQMKLKLVKNYQEDLSKVYQSASYTSFQCSAMHELTVADLQTNRTDYNLISILEDDEHLAIDSSVLRMPLSDFKSDQFRQENGKAVVFYCMSGKRSGALINRLLQENQSAEIYSLKGGLQAWQASIT